MNTTAPNPARPVSNPNPAMRDTTDRPLRRRLFVTLLLTGLAPVVILGALLYWSTLAPAIVVGACAALSALMTLAAWLMSAAISRPIEVCLDEVLAAAQSLRDQTQDLVETNAKVARALKQSQPAEPPTCLRWN